MTKMHSPLSILLILPFLCLMAHGKPQLPFLPGALALQPESPSQLADDTCKDSGANCRNWALNGFCTNCYYTCDQRKQYCARTCGFCHPNYVCTTCKTPLETDKNENGEVLLV